MLEIVSEKAHINLMVPQSHFLCESKVIKHFYESPHHLIIKQQGNNNTQASDEEGKLNVVVVVYVGRL